MPIDDSMEAHIGRVGTHKPGSITKIILKNFLTYSYVDFEPGPRLNMVAGPNGTGKSTILNAICLGLGGEPKLLGRADDVRHFIAHSKDKATIEIHIQPHPGKEPHVFRRIIDANKGSEKGKGRGASEFFINGQKSKIAEVKQVVQEEYNISIDNLCTFLPQDRVGNFSGFNPQDLLIETEKSMSGSQHLWTTHCKLMELETEYNKGDTDVSNIQDKLTKLEADHARLEREKVRMEEREQAMVQKELLEKKLLWLQYDSMREECVVLNQEKKETKEKYQKAKKEKVDPLQKEHNDLKSKSQQYNTKYSTLDKEISKAKSQTEKNLKKFENHNEHMEQVIADLGSCDSDRRQKERKVKDQETKLAKLQQEAADHVSMEDAEEAMVDARSHYKAALPAFKEATKLTKSIESERQEKDAMVRKLGEKLKSMNDEKKQRRDRIFRQHHHLANISKWLGSNRKIFRRPVWGPIACEVDLKTNNAAAYLEQHVPNSALKMFVVETQHDYNLLYQKIREEKGWPINIHIVKDGTLKPLEREYSAEMYRTLKQQHGVHGYLDESFAAPDPIMQALRDLASVHKVLVGSEKTQQSLDDHGLIDFLTRPRERGGSRRASVIFSSQGRKSFKYTTIISRYSGQPSTRADEIGPARMLIAGIDPKVKQRLERELEDAKAQMEQLDKRLQEAQEASEEVTQTAQHAKGALEQAKKVHQHTKKLVNRIKLSEVKLETFKKELEEVDSDGSKTTLIRQLKKRVEMSITALDGAADSHKATMKSTFASAGTLMMSDELESAEKRVRILLSSAMEEFKELEHAARTAVDKYKERTTALKATKTKADEKAPLHDDEGNELPLKLQLEQLPVENVEEASAALEEAERKANSIDANPEVIRQYEEQSRKIEQIKNQLALFQDSKEAKVKEIDDKAEAWATALENSSRDVDALFGKYMQDLDCAGQIRLTQGEYEQGNDNEPKYGNFKDWGIEIQVKFRKNAKFERLSAQRQSGGERSVSTVMYLMALQELMVSPFRCVDEINQGLDERNERLVFKRIVANSTKKPSDPNDSTSHCGQYFLITPKLLPNLFDMEVEAMTVHIIKNGPLNMCRQKAFTANVLVPLRKRQHPEGDKVGSDDENSAETGNTRPRGERSIPKKKRKVSP